MDACVRTACSIDTMAHVSLHSLMFHHTHACMYKTRGPHVPAPVTKTCLTFLSSAVSSSMFMCNPTLSSFQSLPPSPPPSPHVFFPPPLPPSPPHKKSPSDWKQRLFCTRAPGYKHADVQHGHNIMASSQVPDGDLPVAQILCLPQRTTDHTVGEYLRPTLFPMYLQQS